MIAISILILHLARLLSASIPNAYAWQHETFDATTLEDKASSSLQITPIRTLDDLEKFLVRLPNAQQLLENDDDTTTFDSHTSSDFDNKEALFILIFDTSSSLSSSAPDPSSSIAEENAVTALKRTFQSFADSQRNEQPLRFGIIEIENVKFAAGVFEEMIKKEMGIDPGLGLGLGLGSSAPGPTVVVCLRCGGVEGRVETWVVRESLVVSGSGSGSEGEGGKVQHQELSNLKRWMEEMARPVIGELTSWNYGRTEDTLPTVYVFALSHQKRINLRRTLSALATKYHSSLQIVVVDPIVFPGLMKELGLSLDSDSEGSGSDVAAAVVWSQKSNNGNDVSKIEKLIYHYPNDKPITESNVKQWGLDLYLGRVKPWFPPSSPNDETKKEDGSGSGNGRDEVLKDLKNRVRVVKGGKKATRKVAKRSTGSGSIPGVKIRVAGRDEL
ncbi:hypothetical protein N0V85_007394 [Neurospora sp. IMI 360204]|nr:hypothetical protein N0V85_007394 [Neurospora sp. IMI 360204]